MAPTKRKRRTKHRGTAAGTVVARGRTGRKPLPEESKQTRRELAQTKREARYSQPPTWKASFRRAALISAVFAALMLVVMRAEPGAVITLIPVTLLLYSSMSYFTDRFLHRRYMSRQAGEKPT